MSVLHRLAPDDVRAAGIRCLALAGRAAHNLLRRVRAIPVEVTTGLVLTPRSTGPIPASRTPTIDTADRKPSGHALVRVAIAWACRTRGSRVFRTRWKTNILRTSRRHQYCRRDDDERYRNDHERGERCRPDSLSSHGFLPSTRRATDTHPGTSGVQGITSPPSLVPNDRHKGRLVVEPNQRAAPSAISALTPPG